MSERPKLLGDLDVIRIKDFREIYPKWTWTKTTTDQPLRYIRGPKILFTYLGDCEGLKVRARVYDGYVMFDIQDHVYAEAQFRLIRPPH